MNRNTSTFGHLHLALFIVLISEMIFFVTIFSGCESEGRSINCFTTELASCPDDNVSDGGAGGPGNLSVLNLPFSEGYVSRCNQGPDGAYSHRFTSTQFGVDLDTSNYEGEGLYSPISGRAYVHGSANSTSGFGYHVNIDMEDGRYVILGHLEFVVVENGDEVVAGQFIGIEGCTGSCTGDHVHFGLSEGDASRPADFGESVPFLLRTRDVSSSGTIEEIPVEDLTCDDPSGHRYESQLQSANWHPDGLLLSVPGESEIYAIDQGRLHPFLNDSVMFSYGFEERDVVPMSPHERDCWDMGSAITSGTCYRAVQEGSQVWLAYECETTPGRSRLPIPESAVSSVLQSWNIGEVSSAASSLGSTLLSYPVGMGTARLRDGALVREASNSTVYAVNEGVALPIESWDVFISMGLLHEDILVLADGSLEDVVLGVGSCSPNRGCINASRVRQCGGVVDVSDIADGGAGGPSDEPPHPGDDDDDSSPPGDDDDSTDPPADDDDSTDPPLGDDDDDDDDDDDSSPPGDDDDATVDPSDPPPTTEEPPVISTGVLMIAYQPPSFLAPYTYIEISGEYTLASGSSGFPWTTGLLTVVNSSTLLFVLPGVSSGDSFRFSLEYYDAPTGVLSWGCLGTTPYTTQGSLTATVDGVSVAINLVNNYLGGCEDQLLIP